MFRPQFTASDDETTMLVGDVTLENVTKVSERGGQQAPTKKTEKGFSYGTSVGPEPISATFEAVVAPEKYAQLADIRNADEPFPVTVGFVSLGKCKLDDLQIDQQASTTSHYSVRISVTQIREARTRTTTLVIDSTDGSGDGSVFTGDSGAADPSLARSNKKSLWGDVSVTDTVNDIADAIGF
ncbi:phage baseplate protein [Halorussus sp. MSC15.2]|uniref:phage baseplate protein n=1 Tax=Halorussus sp. MSC15.2 TaxID=2283638 RepID=UPI0013D10549|nr:hypothetical protein [Halorussus sp. MSC15.2]NEU58588.1 hypothetical protein [Halorussus sp. MSC15.2]